MSRLISALNNIELETQDKINLINSMRTHSIYENAEYDTFIQKIIDNSNDTKSIDVYSLFLCLNSEICLNLDQIGATPEIIEDYLSFIEKNFSTISPLDSKQKSELAEKGINKFLAVVDINFAEIKNLEPQSSTTIENIVNLINKFTVFFDENNLSYNSDLKVQLDKTLNKIKKSIATQEQQNQSVEQEPHKDVKQSVTKSEELISVTEKNLQGSDKWQSLVEKIEILKSLVDDERIFETSIVYDDIQNLLANFDPKEYFPEVFFPLYKKIAPIIGDIHKNIDYYSSSIQWSVAKKMYEIDYSQFLDDLEKMPENNFINSTSSSIAKEHFYETNSEAKKEYREKNKVLEDSDAHKPNINTKPKNQEVNNTHQDTLNQNNTRDDVDNISGDDLNKLFDF
ncbi:type VI secretion system protein IglI family protein [Francisella marina]|uniref:Phage tail protein n=1 Tax=Francisella marina TaxID=2249302 RepID=A0ABX5ZH11_9GAMM|nr:type VI secretion system protein IglI family protein [Francisella marina]QEO57311.1 phage tail protein [Francisella marina]QEO58573.1 phage tail protein [Francisella marina]